MAVDYNAVFGVKPTIPNLEEAQRQSLLANLGNFDDLSSLGAQTSSANQAQLFQQMMVADPLYRQNLALQSQTINDQLNARLPDGAQRYLAQVAAEGNLALGTQGSPFGAQRRTSLAQEAILPWMQQGVQNANAFRQNVAGTSTTPIYDVSKGFLSPEDQAQRDLLASYVAAAPNPGARGKYEEDMAREFFNRTQAAGSTGGGGGGAAGAPRQNIPRQPWDTSSSGVVRQPQAPATGITWGASTNQNIFGPAGSSSSRPWLNPTYGGTDYNSTVEGYGRQFGSPRPDYSAPVSYDQPSYSSFNGGNDYSAPVYQDQPSYSSFDFSSPTYGGTDYNSTVAGYSQQQTDSDIFDWLMADGGWE